jgi:hypothetical protein
MVHSDGLYFTEFESGTYLVTHRSYIRTNLTVPFLIPASHIIGNVDNIDESIVACLIKERDWFFLSMSGNIPATIAYLEHLDMPREVSSYLQVGLPSTPPIPLLCLM